LTVNKFCRDCGQTKDISEFPRNYDAKDGHGYYCKPCQYSRVRARQRFRFARVQRDKFRQQPKCWLVAYQQRQERKTPVEPITYSAEELARAQIKRSIGQVIRDEAKHHYPMRVLVDGDKEVARRPWNERLSATGQAA
jgi:hypothetical protein